MTPPEPARPACAERALRHCLNIDQSQQEPGHNACWWSFRTRSCPQGISVVTEGGVTESVEALWIVHLALLVLCSKTQTAKQKD